MNQIKYLKLPPVPVDLINKIIKEVDRCPLDKRSLELEQKIYGHNVNIPERNYFPVLTGEIYNELIDLYQCYFKEKFVPLIWSFQNNKSKPTATIVPHCDYARRIALQTILDLGGNQVNTVFYKDQRNNKSNLEPEYALFDNVTVDYKIQIPRNRWHMYSVQYFHGVENLEDRRIILSLVLDNNPDYESFIRNNNDLLEKI